jgi:hypothetical protein
MKVNSQLHVPASSPTGKETPVAIGQETGRAPAPVWSLWSRGQFLAPIRNRSSAIQPVAHRYPCSSPSKGMCNIQGRFVCFSGIMPNRSAVSIIKRSVICTNRTEVKRHMACSLSSSFLLQRKGTACNKRRSG